MGQITAPFGIKGWIKVQTFTSTPESLLAYPQWWIGHGSGWQEHWIERAQVQSGSVVGKVAGCDDRDAAMLFRGREVAVPRGSFPALGENEFYWADLIGLRVVNTDGTDLGVVSQVLETGANDVLVVDGDRERLVPFTQQVVRQVDIAGCVIRVDWGVDY